MRYDAVLIPSVASTPPKIADIATDSDAYVAENLKVLRNTRIGNVLGLCALTLPTGVPSAGLMLMSRPNTEGALLRLGAAVEKVLA
jgi:aspartyl-tRNA(Asn)/glutamyl-tRNA(Gln) amidotransferase subunit A